MRTFIARGFQSVRRIGLVTTCRVVQYALAAAYRTYHPKRTPIRRDLALHRLPGTAVRIPVPRSRVSLHAWYIPAPGATRSVLVGHAIGRNKGFSLPYAEFLHRAGYNVLVFDHRNHGESDRDRAFWRMARRFTDDMQAALSWIRTRHSPEIAILTFSFSTFPALVALNRGDGAVHAIVSDSGPCLSVESLSHHFLEAGKALMPDWLVRPDTFELFTHVYTWIVTRMLHTDWPPNLQHSTTPVLFIANECDIIMPPEDVQEFAAGCNRSELWQVPGASHLAAFKADPERYSQVVVTFLARAFREVADSAPRCI